MSTLSPTPQTTSGFTWPKLVAVATIVGLLAAIVIPLYLDQVKKAHDADTKANLSAVAAGIVASVGKDQTAAPVLEVSGTSVVLDGNTLATLSPGVVLGALEWVSTDDWCIGATHPGGKHAAAPGYKVEGPEADPKTGQCK